MKENSQFVAKSKCLIDTEGNTHLVDIYFLPVYMQTHPYFILGIEIWKDNEPFEILYGAHAGGIEMDIPKGNLSPRMMRKIIIDEAGELIKRKYEIDINLREGSYVNVNKFTIPIATVRTKRGEENTRLFCKVDRVHLLERTLFERFILRKPAYEYVISVVFEKPIKRYHADKRLLEIDEDLSEDAISKFKIKVPGMRTKCPKLTKVEFTEFIMQHLKTYDPEHVKWRDWVSQVNGNRIVNL